MIGCWPIIALITLIILYLTCLFLICSTYQNAVYVGKPTVVTTLSTHVVFKTLPLLELIGGLIGLLQGITGWQFVIAAGSLIVWMSDRANMSRKLAVILRTVFYTVCAVVSLLAIAWLLIVDLNVRNAFCRVTFVIVISNIRP